MKKLIALLIPLILVLTSGCEKADLSENKINVVCTVFPLYDFVREIAGDSVNLSMLLPPGGEAHSYEPSPKDIITLREADIFVTVGGESEHWALHLMENEELQDTPTLVLMDTVTKYTEEHTEGMEGGHTHEHSDHCNHATEEEYDEHIWTSPQNAIIMCREICDALICANPGKSDLYASNTTKYISKLEKLQSDFVHLSRTAARNTVVFGDRFPMRYLIEDMKLDYFAAFPGCSSKTEPSVKTLVFLTRKIKEEKIPTIFYMDYGDARIAKTIAEECGIKALRLYSCHNLSKTDFDKGMTYISLMEKNLKSMEEALK